jgi:glycosyltransferase involved in cell wall biosynthesis
LDIAIEAFVLFKRKVANAEFHIYGGGGGDMKSSLKQLVQRLGIEGSVKFCAGVVLDEMPGVIANADLGVVPKRADSFGNEAYSTKIMEFMSQGVPVVVSQTKVDTFYFDEGVVHFFRSGDSQAMAQAMLDVVNNQQLRESLVTRGFEHVEQNGWGRKKKEYLDLIDSLSTECFDEIQLNKSAVTPAPILQRGGMAVQTDDPVSCIAVEEILASGKPDKPQEVKAAAGGAGVHRQDSGRPKS